MRKKNGSANAMKMAMRSKSLIFIFFFYLKIELQSSIIERSPKMAESKQAGPKLAFRIQTRYFNFIEEGLKTAEIRHGNPGDIEGKEITIFEDGGEKIIKRVVAHVQRYDTLEEALEKQFSRAQPDAKSAEEALTAYLAIRNPKTGEAVFVKGKPAYAIFL